jgi:HAD superfamily hydrolase (TIGR01509 family)
VRVSDVRAILIDLYDTLVWSRWPTLRDLVEQRTGLDEGELVRAFVRTRPARSVGSFPGVEGDMTAVLKEAGVADDPTLVAELVELERAFLVDGVHLYEDSLPVMRALREREIRVAVVSNCSHSTRPIIDRLGLEEEADAVVLSFEVGVAKPDAGIYLTALERLRVAPDEAVFVDDQAAYGDGATRVGMSAYLIQREGAMPDEGTSEPGGRPVIGDLRALLDLV